MFAHGVTKQSLMELSSMAFVERSENVVMLGPSGEPGEESADGLDAILRITSETNDGVSERGGRRLRSRGCGHGWRHRLGVRG